MMGGFVLRMVEQFCVLGMIERFCPQNVEWFCPSDDLAEHVFNMIKI